MGHFKFRHLERVAPLLGHLVWMALLGVVTGCTMANVTVGKGVTNQKVSPPASWVFDGILTNLCPQGYNCQIGVSKGHQELTEAVETAVNLARGSIANEIFPVTIDSDLLSSETLEYSNNSVTEFGKSSNKVRSRSRGRIRGGKQLDSYWERRAVHTLNSIDYVYDAWAVIGVSERDLETAYSEEINRAKKNLTSGKAYLAKSRAVLGKGGARGADALDFIKQVSKLLNESIETDSTFELRNALKNEIANLNDVFVVGKPNLLPGGGKRRVVKIPVRLGKARVDAEVVTVQSEKCQLTESRIKGDKLVAKVSSKSKLERCRLEVGLSGVPSIKRIVMIEPFLQGLSLSYRFNIGGRSREADEKFGEWVRGNYSDFFDSRGGNGSKLILDVEFQGDQQGRNMGSGIHSYGGYVVLSAKVVERPGGPKNVLQSTRERVKAVGANNDVIGSVLVERVLEKAKSFLKESFDKL